MSLSNASFWNGFSNSFKENGGYDKLGSWIGRNFAGGKLYDPYSDPVFIEKYSTAKQLGTEAAKDNFSQEFGQFVQPGENMTPQEYFFGKDPVTYKGFDDFQGARSYIKSLVNDKAPWDNIVSEIDNINTAGFDFSLNPDHYKSSYDDALMKAALSAIDPMYNLADRISQDGVFSPAELDQWTNLGYKGAPGDYSQIPDNTMSPEEILRMGGMQLTEEQRQRLEDNGTILNQIPGYENYWFNQGQLPQEPKSDPLNDYDNKFTVAKRMYSDDNQFGENDLQQWTNLGYEGSPSDVFSPMQQEPGYDYNSLSMGDLAQSILMDGQVTPHEQGIWDNSPYQAFGTPQQAFEANQPAPKNKINLGSLIPEMGIGDIEVTLDEAGNYVNLMLQVQKLKQSNIPKKQWTIDVSDITGNPAHSNVPLDIAKEMINVTNSINKRNNDVNKSMINPTFDDIVSVDKEGNPIYQNNLGFKYQIGQNESIIPIESEEKLSEFDKNMIYQLNNGVNEEGEYTYPTDKEGYIIDPNSGGHWTNPVNNQPYDTTPEEGQPITDGINPWNPLTWDWNLLSNGKSAPQENGPIDDITTQFREQFNRDPRSQEELVSIINKVSDEVLQERYGMTKQELIDMLPNVKNNNPYSDITDRAKKTGQETTTKDNIRDLYNRLTKIKPDIKSPLDVAERIQAMDKEIQQEFLNKLGMSLDEVLNSLQALHSGGKW